MWLTHYQPNIPPNGGAVLRLAECLGGEADLIQPFGCLWDDQRLRCTELHYLNAVKFTRHRSRTGFDAASGDSRLVFLATHGSHTKSGLRFASRDFFCFAASPVASREMSTPKETSAWRSV